MPVDLRPDGDRALQIAGSLAAAAAIPVELVHVAASSNTAVDSSVSTSGEGVRARRVCGNTHTVAERVAEGCDRRSTSPSSRSARPPRRWTTMVVDAESFLVDKHNHLLTGEAERAASWGASLVAALG